MIKFSLKIVTKSMRIIFKHYAHYSCLGHGLKKFQRNWHKTEGGVLHTK